MVTHWDFLKSLLGKMYDGWTKKLTLLAILLLLCTGYLPVDPHSTAGCILGAFNPYRFYVAGAIALLSIYFSAFRLVQIERAEKVKLTERLHHLEQSLIPALLLSFDQDDESCTRSWSDAPQHLYRVRLHNPPPSARNIDDTMVKIESIKPSMPDLLGVTLRLRHEGLPIARVNLKPDQKEYFDFLQFNPKDETSGKPELLLWHTVAHVPVQLPVGDYEFTLRAYGTQANSTPIRLSFTLADRYNYRLRQLAPS